MLSKKTKNIDLIIGGHTHTFLKTPQVNQNLDQKEVLITQVGWAGINIGQIDFIFGRKMSIKNISGKSIFVKNDLNSL